MGGYLVPFLLEIKVKMNVRKVDSHTDTHTHLGTDYHIQFLTGGGLDVQCKSSPSTTGVGIESNIKCVAVGSKHLATF